MNASLPRPQHLPTWRPDPRVCMNCGTELPDSRWGCKDVELRSTRQTSPSVTVRVLGTQCRWCEVTV